MLTPRYQGCKMAKDLYSVHETSTELAWALQEEKGLADEEARERDALYERAERLVSALLSIQDKLREAIDDVNEGVSLPLSPSPSESKMTEWPLSKAASGLFQGVLLTLPLCLAGAAASMGDPSTPLGKATRILNNQLQALMSIDQQTSALEAQLEQVLSAAGNTSNGNLYS